MEKRKPTPGNPRAAGRYKDSDPCQTFYLTVRISALAYLLTRMSKRAIKEKMVYFFEKLYEAEKLKELQEKMGE